MFVTTLLDGAAVALLLLAAVLAFVPSSYVVPAALTDAALSLLLVSWRLTHETAKP